MSMRVDKSISDTIYIGRKEASVNLTLKSLLKFLRSLWLIPIEFGPRLLTHLCGVEGVLSFGEFQ